MEFKEINANQLKENAFDLFKRDLLLLTVEKDGKVNPMTVGWGGLGVMWGKDVVFAVVRPERFTHGLLKDASHFSLSAFTDKSVLTYCGSVSGRDEDKVKKLGLTVLKDESAPYFEQARLNIICKKLFSSAMSEENFLSDSGIPGRWYKESGYHVLYVAEIEKILIR